MFIVNTYTPKILTISAKSAPGITKRTKTIGYVGDSLKFPAFAQFHKKIALAFQSIMLNIK